MIIKLKKMAIQKEINSRTGTNTGAIEGEATIAAEFPKWHRFRVTDSERGLFGGVNCLTITNNSVLDVDFRLGLNIEDGYPLYTLKAGATKNINVEDGMTFYGFDIRNPNGAGNDVAIGEIVYTARWVKQISEHATIASNARFK